MSNWDTPALTQVKVISARCENALILVP
jgi:hypothetical protein